MATSNEWTFDALDGERVARTWRAAPGSAAPPRYIALLVHGYGEHIGRYEYVADVLVEHGGIVYGVDHVGHGKSAGDRVVVRDFEDVVTDVNTLAERARADTPGLPVVLIGHSMGGMIGARYAQRYGEQLAALVLSGPVLGRWQVVDDLLPLDPIPDTPIDPSTLSRDPSVGEAYVADPLVWHGAFQRPTLQALNASLALIARSGDLGALPTLWVQGEDDQLVALADSRAGIEVIAGSALTEHIFPGARHEVFKETNRDEVLAVVTGFIDGVLQA
ncbi:alpha/beta hydrolase [Subtercola boreus]|uniref:Lysophospholipase n=1 Tax=Subtercola boreus TaxID=120213 RepID=A0A3E0W7P6_9MICO|nr:alpha/beta hydrolase [Subtercola boreus]RFA18280.1 lysophospholipase [Subtercola boreus]RFA18672.1 lysophospholipase [Subtercola boreus]RFA25275.1 lysophospholipase [Subtercola boreus]